MELTSEIKRLFERFGPSKHNVAANYNIGSLSRLLRGKSIDRQLTNALARFSGKSSIFWLVLDHQSRVESLRLNMSASAVKELCPREPFAAKMNRRGALLHPGQLLKLLIQRNSMSVLDFSRRTGISAGTLSHVLQGKEYLAYKDCVRVSLATMNANWYWIRLHLCHRYQDQMEKTDQVRVFLGNTKVKEIQKYISDSMGAQGQARVYRSDKYRKVPGLYLVEACVRKAEIGTRDVMIMLSLPETFYQRSSRGLDLWDIAKAKKLFGIDPLDLIDYQIGFFSNKFQVHRRERLRLQSTFDTRDIDFSEPNEVLKNILLPMGHNLESLSVHLGYSRKYLTLMHSTNKTPVGVIVKIAAALRMPVEFWSFVFLLKRIRLHSKVVARR